jgi:two-component system, response regulator RegA
MNSVVEQEDTEQSRSVLLVDDDEIFVSTLSRALRRRGYAVTISNSTEDAKRSVAEDPPDYAVIDLRLPDGSGLCLASAIRECNPDCSFVILTGYGSIASAVEAVKLGAINYLCKPVDADAVIAALGGGAAPETETPAPPPDQPLTVSRLEWEHINRVLAEHNGNISAAARALNMHRRSLQRKLLKYPVKR